MFDGKSFVTDSTQFDSLLYYWTPRLFLGRSEADGSSYTHRNSCVSNLYSTACLALCTGQKYVYARKHTFQYCR